MKRLRAPGRQAGLTLVELMISMALGLLVILVTTTLLVSTKSTYVAQDDKADIQGTGRYALEIIARAVRQAGYEHWDSLQPPILVTAGVSANVAGLDAASLKATSRGIDAPLTATVNGSDVLALRFFGAGNGESGDGTMLNCGGFSVGGVASADDAEDERGWSIFYVAKGSTGEPELYCKYPGKTSWTAQAIARGIDSFQVLYGIDTDEDGMPNRMMNAARIDALDDEIALEGENAEEKAVDRNRKTHWKKVVAVQVALLVRGASSVGVESVPAEYDLFGKDYGDAYGAIDRGVRIRASALPAGEQGRLRSVFSTSIQLRNRSGGSGT